MEPVLLLMPTLSDSSASGTRSESARHPSDRREVEDAPLNEDWVLGRRVQFEHTGFGVAGVLGANDYCAVCLSAGQGSQALVNDELHTVDARVCGTDIVRPVPDGGSNIQSSVGRRGRGRKRRTINSPQMQSGQNERGDELLGQGRRAKYHTVDAEGCC